MYSSDSASYGPDTLVYGIFQGDEVVFLPRQQALDLARLWRALDSAQTWGHFQRMVPAHVYEEVLQMLPGTAVPEPDAPFDRDEIPGHADGDWPALPAQQMLDWVPRAVQDAHGRVVTTRFNGDYLCFTSADAVAVARALAEHGYTCVRDDDLARDASGT